MSPSTPSSTLICRPSQTKQDLMNWKWYHPQRKILQIQKRLEASTAWKVKPSLHSIARTYMPVLDYKWDVESVCLLSRHERTRKNIVLLCMSA